MNTADVTPREIVEFAMNVLKANFEGVGAAYWGMTRFDNPYTGEDEVSLARVWENARSTYYNSEKVGFAVVPK